MIEAAIATTPQSVTAIAKSTSFGFSRIRRRIFANRFSTSASYGDTATRAVLFPEVPRDRWAQKQSELRRNSAAFQPRSAMGIFRCAARKLVGPCSRYSDGVARFPTSHANCAQSTSFCGAAIRSVQRPRPEQPPFDTAGSCYLTPRILDGEDVFHVKSIVACI